MKAKKQAKLVNKKPEIEIEGLLRRDPRYFEFVSKFKEVAFLVEADSFARLELWSKWYNEEDDVRKKIHTWEEISPGFCPTIGTCDNRPVCLSLSYNILNGKRVVFYDPVSQVVDHELVEKYLKLNFPGVGCCDAMNFHQCMDFVSSK
jgi:hypothetical protein